MQPNNMLNTSNWKWDVPNSTHSLSSRAYRILILVQSLAALMKSNAPFGDSVLSLPNPFTLGLSLGLSRLLPAIPSKRIESGLRSLPLLDRRPRVRSWLESRRSLSKEFPSGIGTTSYLFPFTFLQDLNPSCRESRSSIFVFGINAVISFRQA